MAKPPSFAGMQWRAIGDGVYQCDPTRQFWDYWRSRKQDLQPIGFRVFRAGSQKYGRWLVNFDTRHVTDEQIERAIAALGAEE